ncbi:MAG: hypothetical protein K8L99_26460 [Anaerolineae bacterium]|nr:hypothetical protein [Anaerolineae bacterium]
MTQPSELQNLLSAVTDAILAEEADLDNILAQYQVPREQVTGFVALIKNLHQALVGVQPSKRFVRRLKQDLIATGNVNVLVRVRSLPPRVQIAAGIALVAGFMIISRRRLMTDAQEETQERVPAS